MANNKTIRERLAVLETKMETQITWMKGLLVALIANIGINFAI